MPLHPADSSSNAAQAVNRIDLPFDITQLAV
jgi:hypothetical protein